MLINLLDNLLFLHIPLRKLILSHIAIVMYTFDNDMLPDVINNLYKKNKDVHSHYTRANTLLRIPKGTLTFTNVSARVWNILKY